MTFKVYYQPSKKSNPKRENTHVMYFEAKDEVEARHLVETHFPEYNVERIAHSISPVLSCVTFSASVPSVPFS